MVKQCPVNWEFQLSKKNENDNPMTIFVQFRFNLFLMSEKNYAWGQVNKKINGRQMQVIVKTAHFIFGSDELKKVPKYMY